MSNIKLESGHDYTLSQFFSGENKIIIPDLQRDYCWGDKAWNKDTEKSSELVSGFLNSLLSTFSEKPNEKLTLGLIYGYESPRNHIQLCDGQQRITTLFLILGMLNRKTDNLFQNFLISDFEFKDDDKEPYLQYAIRESTLYFLSDLVCNFFLDKEITTKEIKKQDWYFKEYDLDASIQSMIAAIQIIENRLDSNIDHRGFGEFVTHNLQMIYYDMGHRTRGEETFVVINTTGEPLSATENLKPILIGNIIDNEIRKKRSEEWEEREEWFWQNRQSDETTSDNALNDFFIWFWQIRLLQESSWRNKKSYKLNPKELFLKKPSIDENNEENPEIESWEESIKPETFHRYFIALEKLVERSKESETEKVLRTIQDKEVSLSWFRDSSLDVVLPLIAYIEKFDQGEKFYEFVRRIRKNFYDKKWDERSSNYIDWRHIIQIIEFSDTENQVLMFETKSNTNRFKKISNVVLNEWYNEEEKIKSEINKHSDEIEKWEDHQDFRGDLSFLFSINEKRNIQNSIENIQTLQKYYNNYIGTIELIRKQNLEPEKAKLSNLCRLFMLYIGCNKVEHKPRVAWEIEGVLFSTVGRNHLIKEKFKEFCSNDEDKLESFCLNYILEKIKEWNLFDLNENNFSPDKMIKCWLTLKTFKAIKEKVCLAYYDGNNREEGVSAYKDKDKNKLLKHEPFSIENMICGFGVKSGGGGSYIHYTDQANWLKADIIDTPFMSVSRNEKDRTLEQLIENKREIAAIIDSITNS